MMKMPAFQAQKVWLAPMSGSTDAAFRRQAVRYGAPIVVSEMVAGEALAAARPDVVRKTCRHEGKGLWVVQLAGRRPEDMRNGAEILVDAGVDVIDINMGCPSRQVTGGNSGSALMREPELALQIVEATLAGAGSTPVTLKMRLGWDHNWLNAPELARAAVDLGVLLITVQGRTRCQFYKGEADWPAIRNTVEALNVPVIANGDIQDVNSALRAQSDSTAYGVMIGRAAMGQPWLLGEIASHFEGVSFNTPTLDQQADGLCEQVEDSLSLYGASLGVRIVRKHIAAHVDKVDLPLSETDRRVQRGDLCRISDPKKLLNSIQALYAGETLRVAA
ncbi:MAG: tRNA-dihydrouridine synthase [Henriciella sp.]|nr:tRNA-dihydrouridine synthase [Henriciella sp.]